MKKFIIVNRNTVVNDGGYNSKKSAKKSIKRAVKSSQNNPAFTPQKKSDYKILKKK